MPTFVRTDKCDGCKGQDKTACMYICPHDLMMLDKDGSETGHAMKRFQPGTGAVLGVLLLRQDLSPAGHRSTSLCRHRAPGRFRTAAARYRFHHVDHQVPQRHHEALQIPDPHHSGRFHRSLRGQAGCGHVQDRRSSASSTRRTASVRRSQRADQAVRVRQRFKFKV